MKKTSFFSFFIAMMLFMSVPFASADKSFSDLDDEFWGIKEINELYSKKIVTGYDDSSFRPNNDVSRAEAAIMITRALKLDTENVPALTFLDVDAEHYAYSAIGAVANAGIMNGYNNYFQPDQGLSRGEMAIVLANAFELAATAENTFEDVAEDHFAFKAIHYLYAYNITTGYPDKTFKPNRTTNRAEFAVLLSKALAVPVVDNGEEDDEAETVADLATLLAEIQANEFALNSYEFVGNAEIGLTLPELEDADAEDIGMLLSMFENIRVHMTGAYAKDPMQLQMLMEVVLNEEMGLSLEMPVIMTKDAIYMKMGDLLGGSEQEKFIKMDLAELAEMSEQDAVALDMELQFELSKMLNDLMTKHLIDFYSEVDLSTIEIEQNPNAHKAIKFEVTNDTIESFIGILFEDLLPELLELMQNPEYSAAFGLSAEDLELLLGADFTIDLEDTEFQEMLLKLREALQIRELTSHVVIDENNIALDHLLNADVDITLEGETLGLKVNAILQKQKINEDVTFPFEIPADEDTISLDDLFDFDEDDYDHIYDEDFEFEIDEFL